MNGFMKEILEVPSEIYGRCDSWINEKIRPLTQNLDEHNPRYKYILGNNAPPLFVMSLLFGFQPPAPLGLYALNFLSNGANYLTQIVLGEHKGYVENPDGSKIIRDPIIYRANRLSKKLRLASVLEGGLEVSIGLYNIIADRDFSTVSFFLITNGLQALNVGIGTYIFQADDEKPRKSKEFSGMKQTLEKLLSRPELQPVTN